MQIVNGASDETIDGTLSVSGSATFSLSHIAKTTTATLTPSECKNTVIHNLGQSAEMTLTLPTAAEGYSFLYHLATAAQTSHIKAGASDKIYLDGVPLDDADKVSNNGASSTVLDAIRFYTFETSSGVYDWAAFTLFGTWSDGGA